MPASNVPEGGSQGPQSESGRAKPPWVTSAAPTGTALPQAQTDETLSRDDVLPIAGFQGTPDEIERQWFDKVYRGRGDSMAQLTWRAILMGSALGGILSLTNLYIGLKAGWGFGVAITACILSYAIWTTLHRIGIVRTRMTILENNCMQSTASAAGYSTGGTLVSAISAYMIVTHENIPTLTLMAWVFFLAVLGVTMAILMKRQMINIEQLRFPSGIAAAETLKALHTTGGRGMQSAKALGIAGIFGAASKFWEEGLLLISNKLGAFQLSALFGKISLWTLGSAWVDRTVTFSWDPIFIAAGAITGMRVCASMLLGSVLCWMVFVPLLQAHLAAQHEVVATGFNDLVQWTLWGGAACMVTSGLLSFGLQWRSALRAFASFGRLLTARRSHGSDELAKIEAPASWFLAGQVVGTVGLAYLAHDSFGMPYWLTVFAVLFSFAMALVACRVCGETDTTPVGPMGKVTQLTFGAIQPHQMKPNLMGACITAAAADSSSDLLTDLKSGYLLGANPRQQFIAQFAGIFMGTVASVLSFQMVVPNADVLGTSQFPAPSAQTWAAVAQALGKGLADLGPIKVWSIVIGGLVGVVLPVLELLFPKHRKYIPSAAGLGLAWTFSWDLGLLFFLGALIGWTIEKRRPKLAEQYTFPVAAGVIAGGSLMGVALRFIANGAGIWHQLFGN